MGVFAFFSYSTRSVEISAASIEQKATDEAQIPESSQLKDATSTPEPATAVAKAETLTTPNDNKEKDPSLAASASETSQVIVVSTPDSISKTPASNLHPQVNARRFSLRAFSFPTRGPAEQHKPALSMVHEHLKKVNAAAAFAKRAKPRFSSSMKRAKESALMVRSLIVGPSAASPKVVRANAKPQLNKLKSQLVEPKSANKVIAQLRALPISDDLAHGKAESSDAAAHLGRAHGPIYAVCLEYSDAEEDRLHFAPLSESSEGKRSMSYVGSASVEQVTTMFSQMNLVDLVRTPDLGLGQPGNGRGILAGAVPTAETVLKGAKGITPQLMALGYATGRSIRPDHAGIYPPTDRMTILTYWWGLELVLPPPSLEYLAEAQSIAGTVVNFLSALALINNGVREILPFVRYIAQFIDYEFDAIKREDKGKGVVCAATWIMPAAMVPRPWDFPNPPADLKQPATHGDDLKSDLPSVVPPDGLSDAEPLPPPPGPPPPIVITPSLPTFADGIVGAYADSVHFQTVASPSKVDVK